MLVHGSGQSRYSWRATAEELAGRGFRAISYDLRGHGESDRAENYGVEAHVTCAPLLEEEGAPAILVGASLGALAALHLLGGESDRIAARALVMIDIGHRFNASGSNKMAGTEEGFDSLDDAHAAIARYLPHRAPRRPGGGLLKTLIQRYDGRYYWRWDPATLPGQTPQHEVEALSLTLADCLGRVAVPTLVVRGTNSEILSRDTAEEMIELLPNGQLAEVDGAHHMVAGDDNNAFMSALLGFIEGVGD